MGDTPQRKSALPERLAFTLVLLVALLPLSAAIQVHPGTQPKPAAGDTIPAAAGPQAEFAAYLPLVAASTHSHFTYHLPIITNGCPPLADSTPGAAIVTGKVPLYAGPANRGYPVVALLSACTAISVDAVYGAFARVQVLADTGPQTGFLQQWVVHPLPPNLPILGLQDVPWQVVDLFNRFTVHPDIVVRDDILVVENADSATTNEDLPVGLTMEGPFEIRFRVETDGSSYGSIKLADQKNSATGNHWLGIRRVDFATIEGMLHVELRDGSTETAAANVPLPLSDQETVIVNFLDANGKIFVVATEDGEPIATVDVTQLEGLNLPDGLFPERRVYFGRVASPHAELKIPAISLRVAPTGQWQDVPTFYPTLAQHGRRIGVSTGTEFVWSKMRDPRYWDIMFETYDIAILSEFSWKSFWRARGDYDFAYVDRIVDWCMRNGFRVRASHLVYGSAGALPEWLVQGEYSRDEAMEILQEHIHTVVGHYKGRVSEWSVANEAVSRSFTPGTDFWADTIGPEYVEMALRWTRELDPDAILILNDANNEHARDASTMAVIERMLQVVADLKARQVPLDVVGMQGHLLAPGSSPIAPWKAGIMRTMTRFGALGVSVYVTEFDVNLQDVAGSQDSRWSYQSWLYREMVSACIDSGVCHSFSTWGISDGESWLTCTAPGCLNLPNADPLMFDRNYQHKPAYYAVYDEFTVARTSSAQQPKP